MVTGTSLSSSTGFSLPVPPLLHTHLSSGTGAVDTFESAVQSLNPFIQVKVFCKKMMGAVQFM
jgi:hypothetical protein